MTYQFGWFSTGRDQAAGDLLTAAYDNIARSNIKAEIAFVFSSREPGESRESDLFHALVAGYNIPLVYFSYRKFRASQPAADQETIRLSYDRQVMQRLKRYHADLCILAGYMLIVGKEMCQKYDMINLHPAEPGGPTGTWQEVIWKLISQKAKRTGVMMHLVIPELDKGPPVTFCTFSIRGKYFDRYWTEIEELSIEEIKKKDGENNQLFKTIREHGLAREFPLIIATLKAFSEGRVKITADKKVVDAEGKPVNGYDLTDEIEKIVKESLKNAKSS